MKKHQLTPCGILIVLLTILFSCSFQKQSEENAETIRIDSLLSVYIDSLAVNPLDVVSVLRDNQKNVLDSLNYYSLQQTISRCFFSVTR